MIRYYTYKNQVPLKPGEKLGFKRGRGYYAMVASPPPRSLSQYVLFAAQEPEKGLQAPAKYTVALSADPAYRDASVAAVAPLRKHGHKVAGWCDCRPAPDGTPAAVGAKFVKDHGLDYFIGQAESVAEFDNAMTVNAKVVIGGLAVLLARADVIKRDGIEFICEDYWNEGWGRGEHPLISAYCAGIYPTPLWNPQIYNYRQAGRWREGDGAYHVAAIEDPENLP